MAIGITATVSIDFIGDGAGAMEVPGAQRLKFAVPLAIVPGANAPTAANFATAFTTLATTLGATLTTAQIAQINAWASGGN